MLYRLLIILDLYGFLFKRYLTQYTDRTLIYNSVLVQNRNHDIKRSLINIYLVCVMYISN